MAAAMTGISYDQHRWHAGSEALRRPLVDNSPCGMAAWLIDPFF
jgi:hypothetical protein